MQHALHNLSLSFDQSQNYDKTNYLATWTNILPSLHRESFCCVCVYIFFFYHLHHRSNHLHFSGSDTIKNLQTFVSTQTYVLRTSITNIKRKNAFEAHPGFYEWVPALVSALAFFLSSIQINSRNSSNLPSCFIFFNSNYQLVLKTDEGHTRGTRATGDLRAYRLLIERWRRRTCVPLSRTSKKRSMVRWPAPLAWHWEPRHS